MGRTGHTSLGCRRAAGRLRLSDLQGARPPSWPSDLIACEASRGRGRSVHTPLLCILAMRLDGPGTQNTFANRQTKTYTCQGT